ncbi:Receptor-like protein 12 [Vitis vinifera]|uniref:Receptor-like protein 12 n=1 Tax=Vitis vinifera TaxID=29760 RepID=A0A438HHP2_VITVI|nr:Receptor-like protein 12 [Vitis vinifera]
MRILVFLWLFFLPLCSVLFRIHIALVSGECLGGSRLCLEDEKSMLLQLKNSLKFKSNVSMKLVTWNESVGCCSWEGVTWDSNGHVVGLDLSSELISGGFNSSSSLFSLRHLQRLNLANNSFNSSQIPSGFDKLGNLTYLNLSATGFYGQIPIEISRLTRLVTIDFSILYFPGVPTLKLENPNLRMLVQNLAELRELYLNGVNISAQGKEWCRALSSSVPISNNNFSAPVPEFLANFSNLTQLRLSSCGLYGTFPEKIFQNGSLETLVLPDTKFSGKVPNSIGNLKRLTRIELARCNFSGPIPNSTANLARLVYLDLSENKFSGPIPPFSLSKNLTRINLSHNHLTGPIPSSHLDGLVNLVTLDLSKNSLNGSLPMPLFSLPSLQKIQLSNNQFSGQIPVSIFDLQCLSILDLSSNKFNGTVLLSSFQKLGNLTTLSLSYNNLSINSSVGNPTLPLLLNLTTLKLASCKLRTLPDLSTQSRLTYLDLSITKFPGAYLIGFGRLLHGQIPTPPQFCSYVDYSDNRFTSSIPDGIGVYISFTIFFSLSKNNITGSIPRSICNATYLQVLDFSNNNLSGKIPSCLIEYGTLGVLNLRRNNFSGAIPGKFPVNCLLQTLDLSRNHIEGKIPGSLANCTALEVLNLGNNQMNGTFPCLLKNITTLRVLVLRGNNFQGSIGCRKSNSTWAMLQIVDLAFQQFQWVLQFSQLYYQDAVTVTSKGLEMELVKVLTLYTSIDLSCNNFQGDIPEVMGNFTSLYVLNLSHNGFTGHIPSSIGNLRQLESLDLSRNRLSGEIPTQLANLNFLSVLNLSFNQLVGRIPPGNQMQTFSETSYEGNKELNNCCAPNLLEEGRKWLDECVDRFVLLILPIVRLLYTNYGRVEAEEAFGIELTDITGGYEDSDEEKDEIEFGSFDVRFCVFCTKLDIGMKKPIHDPNCSCHDSPPILSSSSSSSSSSSQI